MGRPPIGKARMSGAERTRRHRARRRAANPSPVTTAPASDRCAWCSRLGGTMVGENGVMICAKCIDEAHVAIAEARAAKRRIAALRQDQAASGSD
jgi:hypothetical protein